MDSTERFSAHFKVPKAEINRIKKDYTDAIGKIAEQKTQYPPEKFLNFTELAKEVFDHFEEASGKKVNRELMQAHMNFWFDEGYGPEEMKPYIAKACAEPYYAQNPEWFTIARLFPIRDQDRINLVWDFLAHYQSLKTTREKDSKWQVGLMTTLLCGHQQSVADYLIPLGCRVCIENGDLLEIAINPYSEFVPEQLKEFASFFKRQTEEDLPDYMSRTSERFSELRKIKTCVV